MVEEELRRLYPFESRYWNRGGLRLHYLDEGRGEPVVMVHGNPTWSFYYRELARELRGSYRVIVPDHIGCGLSDKPDDDRYDYTLKSRVEDLENLLEHLGVKDNITLVVHDWGGAIGMAYACRRPERIRRLAVLNTAAFPPPEGKRFPWALAFCRTGLGALLVRGLNAFCLGAVFSCARRPLAEDIRSAYLLPYDGWKNRVAVLRFVQDIPLSPRDRAYDLVRWTGDNLGRLAGIPMLICWGGKDFVFDRDFFEEWKRRFPRAQAHLFPEAGHYVLEDEGPAIARLLSSFLERHPLSQPQAHKK